MFGHFRFNCKHCYVKIQEANFELAGCSLMAEYAAGGRAVGVRFSAPRPKESPLRRLSFGRDLRKS